MVNTTDIDELIARAQSTFEGVPRNRLAWELASVVVRQQAVVEAARGNKVDLSAYRPDLHVYADPGTLSVALHIWSKQQPEIGDYSKTLKIGALYIESIWETLAALDAPPEGDG